MLRRILYMSISVNNSYLSACGNDRMYRNLNEMRGYLKEMTYETRSQKNRKEQIIKESFVPYLLPKRTMLYNTPKRVGYVENIQTSRHLDSELDSKLITPIAPIRIFTAP